MLELEKLNNELSPILGDILEDIDCKTAIIYFAGLINECFDILDDDDFRKIIIAYIEGD